METLALSSCCMTDECFTLLIYTLRSADLLTCTKTTSWKIVCTALPPRGFYFDLDLDGTGGSGSLRSLYIGNSCRKQKQNKHRHRKSSILHINFLYIWHATFSPETPSQLQSSFHSSLYTVPAATPSIPFLSSPLSHPNYALTQSESHRPTAGWSSSDDPDLHEPKHKCVPSEAVAPRPAEPTNP